VVIALASRSAKVQGGLEQCGQESQWAFGSQGFESLPRRHLLFPFCQIGIDLTGLVDSLMRGGTLDYDLAENHLRCVCIVTSALCFFLSGVETILSCTLFRNVSAASFASLLVV
jgi:hypothetical protein